MAKQAVPTAEQLKLAALSDDFKTVLAMAASDIVILEALAQVGQAVFALRAQVKVLKTVEAQDEISMAIFKAWRTAERTLDRLADAAHLVVKDIVERDARARAARYN